ncbi:hypothetical protein PGT21_004916 [Puccinia graminis f. sp. tritici]|uniref:Uncharacterized protein n=1 Tax=Puccinia graminis f. sp. tritici TaxID=56615 RepID=A0A5B0Q9K6_PUCGR|nr:hypothetical protein PGT21_004916 [Puccinia graminis f. sp. tritici]
MVLGSFCFMIEDMGKYAAQSHHLYSVDKPSGKRVLSTVLFNSCFGTISTKRAFRRLHCSRWNTPAPGLVKVAGSYEPMQPEIRQQCTMDKESTKWARCLPPLT